MRCVICKTGDVAAGRATFTADIEGRTYVVRDVPARVCQQCGEAYYDQEVTRQVMAQVQSAASSGAEVALLHFRAA